METMVFMDAQGRLTVPNSAREALEVDGPAQFQLEVIEGTLVLSHATPIPEEDVWAYTPEHLALIERARRDLEEGRVRRASEDDLRNSRMG